MKKRDFLAAVATTGALPVTAPAMAATAAKGPALLTVTGALARTNRGPFDPVADQMLRKQKLTFDKAWTFDFAALTKLPPVTIRPALEYDNKVHTLTGPLLADVLKAAGVTLTDGTRIALRAVDGYAAAITGEQVRARRYIVATHLDGQPMALGGLGPLWALYDAAKLPEMAAKGLAERFSGCPWALYHIEVLA